MKHSKKFNMSYKLMMRLVEMVESGAISKDNPIFEGRYDEMKRELEKTEA